MAERPPADGDVFNPEPRIGWLLRTSRLAALPEVSAREFAGLLAAEGAVADASRVSRWETGQVAAPFEVIAAYERLADLDPGGLRAIASFQRRAGSGRVASRSLLARARPQAARLERLLDTVVDGHPDGRLWLEFGLGAAASGERLVLPRSLWRSLAHRLLRETSVSVASAYLARSEAATLLTTHPGARRALLQVVGEIAGDPDIPIVSDPLSLLQAVEGPDANQLVMRLMDHDLEPTRNAAARVAATKVSRRHFGTADLAALEALTRRLNGRHGTDRNGSFGGLADLVCVLESELPGQAAPDPVELAAVVEAVSALVDRDDPMLRRLVALSLGEHRVEHRFLAAFTLQQSPFRDAVAAAAARAVAAHVDGVQPLGTEVTHRLLVVLSVVAGPPEAELLLRLAETPAPGLQPLGLVGVGHLPPGGGHRRPRLAGLVEGSDEAVARAATYCAGMTGDPLLRRLVDQPDVPESRRRAAQWWVDNGPAIYELRRVERS